MPIDASILLQTVEGGMHVPVYSLLFLISSLTKVSAWLNNFLRYCFTCTIKPLFPCLMPCIGY
uniref:Uncharacterized protein n=1 Tax=Rhizophora mucronata TaxID=61149 RepID=A0A2P2PGB8_RHIMU